MDVIFKGFPHSISILRATGIERIVTYHPTHKQVPDLSMVTEFRGDDCQNGVYLKWLNKKSGYDYWLFNPQYTERITTRDRGRVVSTDTNRARAVSSTHNIGKEAKSNITVTTTETQERMNRLKYALVSPEVYMFNPQSVLGTVSCAEWNKVFVRPGTYQVRNTNANTQKLKFTFEFDDHNVQSIV